MPRATVDEYEAGFEDEAQLAAEEAAVGPGIYFPHFEAKYFGFGGIRDSKKFRRICVEIL